MGPAPAPVCCCFEPAAALERGAASCLMSWVVALRLHSCTAPCRAVPGRRRRSVPLHVRCQERPKAKAPDPELLRRGARPLHAAADVALRGGGWARVLLLPSSTWVRACVLCTCVWGVGGGAQPGCVVGHTWDTSASTALPPRVTCWFFICAVLMMGAWPMRTHWMRGLCRMLCESKQGRHGVASGCPQRCRLH